MGWLSGTPNWFDKVKRKWPKNIPAPQVMDELERLRLGRGVSHDDFAMIYMWCWWHNEVAIRTTYIMGKRMYPQSDERSVVVGCFIPLAKAKIGFWYKDQEELIRVSLELYALEDVINELKRRHQLCADSFLTAENKHLMGAIEMILEKDKKSMEELFQVFDQSMERLKGKEK